MKYLLLLLFISCTSTQVKLKCVIIEKLEHRKTLFTVFRCNKKDMCNTYDKECKKNTACDENDDGSYTCVRRD
jgi:hypothetical protein